jgi:hypothetical protein
LIGKLNLTEPSAFFLAEKTYISDYIQFTPFFEAVINSTLCKLPSIGKNEISFTFVHSFILSARQAKERPLNLIKGQPFFRMRQGFN